MIVRKRAGVSAGAMASAVVLCCGLVAFSPSRASNRASFGRVTRAPQEAQASGDNGSAGKSTGAPAAKQSGQPAAKTQPASQSTPRGTTSTPAKCCAANGSAKPAATAKPADANVVTCHALETHTNAQPGVSIVIFNQKIKDDHERLSDLLKDNEGASVEIKAADGKWHAASVARLKSCFGRGLLFFPGETSPVQERDDFVVRFPAKKTS